MPIEPNRPDRRQSSSADRVSKTFDTKRKAQNAGRGTAKREGVEHLIHSKDVPVALLVLAAVPALLPTAARRRGRVDVAGALSATAALTLTVYTTVTANAVGRGSAYCDPGARRGARRAECVGDVGVCAERRPGLGHVALRPGDDGLLLERGR